MVESFLFPFPSRVNKGRIPAKRKSAFDTPVRFLCLKNLADMVEREGDDDKALELYVAAAEEDETNLAVSRWQGSRPPATIHVPLRRIRAFAPIVQF